MGLFTTPPDSIVFDPQIEHAGHLMDKAEVVVEKSMMFPGKWFAGYMCRNRSLQTRGPLYASAIVDTYEEARAIGDALPDLCALRRGQP